MLDELGDVLFQVVFLSLLLEERGEGDFAAVAEHCRQKLIRRHPHVFGDVDASTAAEVLRNWDEIKRGEEGREPGIFGDVPENLPAPLYARKLLRRASSAGRELPEMRVAEHVEADDFDSLGDLMLAAVARARELRVDPELALRSAADRFRAKIDQEADRASE
jgi:nucleoside triphosphate diphosphatase